MLRKLLALGALDERRAAMGLFDLSDLDLRRVGHLGLLGRVWELRHAVTPYDAAYVALAEALDTVLVTADERLAGAPGTRCSIEGLS